MNRRSFFGLFGGAAAVPFVKVPAVEAGYIVSVGGPAGTQGVVSGVLTGGPKLLWPGLKAIYGSDFDTKEMIERTKNRIARAQLDYVKMYGDRDA